MQDASPSAVSVCGLVVGALFPLCLAWSGIGEAMACIMRGGWCWNPAAGVVAFCFCRICPYWTAVSHMTSSYASQSRAQTWNLPSQVPS